MSMKLMHAKIGSARGHRAAKKGRPWELKLYVSGASRKASAAVDNLRSVCEEWLKGEYRLTVIDLAKRPKLARQDQIVALPTLVRASPLPVKLIIGDLSNTERLLEGLDVI